MYAPALPFTLSANRLRTRWRQGPVPAGVHILPAPIENLPSLSTRERPSTDSWLGAAALRIEELSNLAEGWDDGSALPVAPELFASVWNFVTSDLIISLPTKPAIVPTFGGGLLIEWHTKAVDLIIESAPGGEVSFYACDNETGEEVEATVPDRLDSLAAVFVKLGQ
jgi:hypothetical protein